MRAKPFLLLLLFPLAARAEPKLSAYEELCTYDALCSRLRNSDGTKVAPKPAVKKLIETMADPVHDFAKLYGVDPRAVAGAILAENSMNVQMDDEIQNWIVKHNIWGSKAALNAGMTIGPGQINIGPAIAADKYIASLGLRPARSAEEITKLLLTPAGAAEYSAAIIRLAQDAYKAEGIDISKRPDVLVTLYNFGENKMSFAERAKETKRLKQEPRPNFFGMFVAENIETVEDAIGWSPEKGRYKKENTEIYESGSLNMVTEDFTLQTSPPSCSTDGAGDQGLWRARQTWEPFKTFSPRRAKYFEISGRGVDCQMREWLQVKTSSGELGWMPKSSLASVSKPLPKWRMAVTACGSADTENCLQKALGAYGQPKLDNRDEKGRYFLTVKKNDPNDPVRPEIRPVALAGRDDRCEIKYPDLKKQIEAMQRQMEGQQQPLGQAELYEIKTKLANKLGELKDFLGIKDEFEEKQVWEPSDQEDDGTKGGGGAGAGSPMGQPYPNMQALSPNGQGFGMGSMYNSQMNGGKLKTVKVKKPSQNNYVKSLEYLEENINSCIGQAKNGCEMHGNEDEFRKFLETDLAKIRSLAEFKKVMSFQVGFNHIEKNDKDAQDEREKNREKAIQALREKRKAQARAVEESCGNVKESHPALHQKIMFAVSEIEAVDDVQQFNYVYPAFERACEQAWLLQEFKANGNKLPDGTGEFNCAYKKQTGLEQFSLDFLAKMNLGSDDYLGMLKEFFEMVESIKKRASLSHNYALANSGGNGLSEYLDQIKKTLAICNYNPLATARAVEELAKIPCVDSILVKDMTLSKSLGGGANARVVFDPGLESHQIGFTMKNDCRLDIAGRQKIAEPFQGGNKE